MYIRIVYIIPLLPASSSRRRERIKLTGGLPLRREGLRLRLALAIGQARKVGHAITSSLAKKHVSRDLLTLYTIRRETKIYPSDWHIACKLAREERASRSKDNIPVGMDPTLTRMRQILDRTTVGSLIKLSS